jgi:hypothetical protein
MQSEKRPVPLADFQAYVGRLAKGQYHPKDCALHFIVDQLASGVQLPVDVLADRFDRYVPLCIQHQYDQITVDATAFWITLNFFRVPHRCRIPWDSIAHAYTLGRTLPVAELIPVPANDEHPKVVRVDFQAKRRL